MNIRIHLPSAIAGASILGLVLLATGAQKPLIHKWPTTVEHVVTVKGIPPPEKTIRITEAEPYTVPADKLFVVTGLGKSEFSGTSPGSVILKFDGEAVWKATYGGIDGDVEPYASVPPGLVAYSGSVVSTSTNNGVILGYLIEDEGHQ